MALKKRVEVLFDPQKYTFLEQIARREKTTVGKLIREAVDKIYIGADLEKRREAAKWLTSQDIDFGGDWGKIKEDMLRGYTEDLEEELGYELDQ